LSKHTNYLFIKLNLFTEITKISKISYLSVTSEIFCIPNFFPRLDTQHVVINQRARTRTNPHLDVLGEVLVLHGEVHGALEARVAGVHHLPRQPRQRLPDVQVVVRVVQVIVPEPCGGTNLLGARRRRPGDAKPRPASPANPSRRSRAGAHRTCGGGRRRRPGGGGPAGSGAGSRTTPTAWRTSSGRFQRLLCCFASSARCVLRCGG
jgi:hypothetical protein